MQDKFAAFNEKKRKSERLVAIGGFIIAVGVLVLFSFYTSMSQVGMILGGIVAFAGFIILSIGYAEFAKLSKTFKVDVLEKLFEETLPGVHYYPDQGLSLNDVYATEYLKRADRSHTEDLIEGIVEDVKFVSSDVRLEERHVEQTKNGTRVYYVAYFVGRIFKFSFNKEFEGHLAVLESGRPLTNRGYQKVEMESIDFNKKFHTYSTNDLSAFYVLTPDIMEAIMKLEQNNPGRIGLTFTGDTLYIAINNNINTFELKMFRQIDNSMVEGFQRDLLVIRDVIVALKLNNNLFKKVQ